MEEYDLIFDRLTANEATILAAEGTSEATTRLRAIDVMLFDVLRWDRLEVDSEHYCRTEGFADYAFIAGSFFHMILEAKKDKVAWIIPDHKFPDRPVGFPYVDAKSPKTGDAMRQAAGYAALKGARYCAVSNGQQWVFTLAFVPGQDINDRSVIVFENLEAIKERFSQFVDCLGPVGVKSNKLSALLVENRKSPPPQKLSASIPNYPAPADRNTLVNNIDFAIGDVWDQMTKNENSKEFLQRCYIKPDANADALREAYELLQRRKDIDTKVFLADAENDENADILTNYSPEKPIIVLGRIGHGKSTFLQYLRLVHAESTFHDYIQIDVTFLHEPSHPDRVREYIYDEIDRQLLTTYDIDSRSDRLVRAVLHSDLCRFQKSPIGVAYPRNSSEYVASELAEIDRLSTDRHAYVGKLLKYLKGGMRKSVAIFLDNIDRRDELKNEAFLAASSMATDWSCPVFLCLRPGTFYRSQQEGVLDTVAPKTLSVSPPEASILLRKRLEYAKEVASGARSFSENVSVKLPETASFLQSAAESFYRSKPLATLFAVVSNGDTRKLLRYVRRMLTSKHLDTKKMLDAIRKTGRYRIAEHEALRALMYGDKRHFDPEESIVANLFDLPHDDSMQHFIKPLLLRYLQTIPVTDPHFGFSTPEDLYSNLFALGYNRDEIDEATRFLIKHGCCETEVPDESWSEHTRKIRITSHGRFHVEKLMCQFELYDAVVVDTPITDTEARESITDVVRIEARLDRGERFLKYLKSQSASIQDQNAVQFFAEKFALAQQNIDAIRPQI